TATPAPPGRPPSSAPSRPPRTGRGAAAWQPPPAGRPTAIAGRRAGRARAVASRAFQTMVLQSAVESAARDAQLARGVAHVPPRSGERALDEMALGVLERHPLEQRRPLGGGAEEQVPRSNLLA